MGKKIRPRKTVQQSAATRSRAAARVLGSRKPKRRHSRTEVSLSFAGKLFINKELIDDGYVVIT